MSNREINSDRRQREHQSRLPTKNGRRIDRRSAADRRDSRRIRLTLETAVPVTIRSQSLVQWGTARNISEGGMLIELNDPPPIGAFVSVKIAGIEGSSDAPEDVILHGEVRHQVAWDCGDSGSLTAIGVRFTAPPPEVPLRPGAVLH